MLILLFLSLPYLGSGTLCYLLVKAKANAESPPRKRLILLWPLWMALEIGTGTKSRFYFDSRSSPDSRIPTPYSPSPNDSLLPTPYSLSSPD